MTTGLEWGVAPPPRGGSGKTPEWVTVLERVLENAEAFRQAAHEYRDTDDAKTWALLARYSKKGTGAQVRAALRSFVDAMGTPEFARPAKLPDVWPVDRIKATLKNPGCWEFAGGATETGSGCWARWIGPLK